MRVGYSTVTSHYLARNAVINSYSIQAVLRVAEDYPPWDPEGSFIAPPGNYRFSIQNLAPDTQRVSVVCSPASDSDRQQVTVFRESWKNGELIGQEDEAEARLGGLDSTPWVCTPVSVNTSSVTCNGGAVHDNLLETFPTPSTCTPMELFGTISHKCPHECWNAVPSPNCDTSAGESAIGVFSVHGVFDLNSVETVQSFRVGCEVVSTELIARASTQSAYFEISGQVDNTVWPVVTSLKLQTVAAGQKSPEFIPQPPKNVRDQT
jgi:hypothetical protein